MKKKQQQNVGASSAVSSRLTRPASHISTAQLNKLMHFQINGFEFPMRIIPAVRTKKGLAQSRIHRRFVTEIGRSGIDHSLLQTPKGDTRSILQGHSIRVGRQKIKVYFPVVFVIRHSVMNTLP